MSKATLFDNMEEASATMAALSGAGEYFVNDDGSLNLDSCILKLAQAIGSGGSSITADGMAESGTATYAVEALTSPFVELSSALHDLLIPPGTTFGEDDGFGDLAKTLAKSMFDAFSGNMLSMFAGQVNVLEMAGEQVAQAYGGSDGIGPQIADRLAYILRMELVSKDEAGLGLLGLVVYGIQSTIPAVTNELVYIRKMKSALKKSMRETGRLPPSMQPNLPNAEAADLLCQAAAHLRTVHGTLRGNRIWDKAEFGQATSKVCAAKDVIGSGKLSKDFAYHIKNMYGLSDLQANALKKFQFIPNPQFRLATLQLIFWGNALQRADPPIKAFHKNLIDLMQTIESLTSLHVADMLAQVIQILHRQINEVRRQLEASGAGFTMTQEGAGALGVDWKALGVPPPPGAEDAALQPREGGQDISSYLGVQTGAYTTLTVLCYLMQRTERLQGALARLIKQNSRIMNQIKAFVQRFSAEDCGDIEGAATIDKQLKAYLTAAEERLRGRVSHNRDVQARGAALKQALDAREAYLNCVMDRLTLGNAQFLSTLTDVTSVIQAVRQLAALAATSTQLARQLQDLSILSGERKNFLDVIVEALQCFLLQCSNPALSDLAQKALDYFGAQRGRDRAKALTIGQLDRLPRAATKAGVNSRIAALLRLILALQKLTSPDIADLCNIQARVVPTQPPAPPSKGPVAPVDPARAARQGTSPLAGPPNYRGNLTR
jgi:hypothetical protein